MVHQRRVRIFGRGTSRSALGSQKRQPDSMWVGRCSQLVQEPEPLGSGVLFMDVTLAEDAMVPRALKHRFQLAVSKPEDKPSSGNDRDPTPQPPQTQSFIGAPLDVPASSPSSAASSCERSCRNSPIRIRTLESSAFASSRLPASRRSAACFRTAKTSGSSLVIRRSCS